MSLSHCASRARRGLTALAVVLPFSTFAQQPAPSSTTATTQTSSTAQAAPPPRPPIPNRLNERLPEWLRARGEFRERVEGFAGGGFDASKEDLYWLSRIRLQATVAPSTSLSFHAQVQDARVAKKTVGPTAAPFSAPFDLRLATVDVGSTSSPVTLRVGRQELAYGEQRLVGHVSWLNAARTFDGAKVTVRTRAFSADAFATSVVRLIDGAFDRSGNGNRFAGAYATTARLLPGASVEPYVFWRREVNLRSETAAVGNLSQATVGVRVAGRLPARFDYGVEMAIQRGSLGSDEIKAWAGHWQLRQSLPGRGAARLVGEYNFASGDQDPSDGHRGTFDQLYPTPHDKYGLADQIGWKNIHHARAGVELVPRKNLTFTANYHSWWLAERGDAVYSAGSVPLARGTGVTSTHVGQELDVQVVRPLTPHVQFAAGYARIFAGAFLRQTTPGASYDHPYVMVTYVFLADR